MCVQYTKALEVLRKLRTEKAQEVRQLTEKEGKELQADLQNDRKCGRRGRGCERTRGYDRGKIGKEGKISRTERKKGPQSRHCLTRLLPSILA